MNYVNNIKIVLNVLIWSIFEFYSISKNIRKINEVKAGLYLKDNFSNTDCEMVRIPVFYMDQQRFVRKDYSVKF